MNMDKIKDLTQEQAIEIASIVAPEIKWIISPPSKYTVKNEGISLIEKGKKLGNSKHFFQIDFRTDEQLKNKNRFRLYDNLYESKISEELKLKINEFIENI